MSKLIHIDAAYKEWIQALSKRYRQSQIKAAVQVNREMLAYYWELGRDIVRLDAENRWGSGFMRMLSQDMKEALPEATGLTRTNLYYCKKFYLLYNQEDIIIPQVGGKLSATSNHKIVPQVEGQIKEAILPQVGAEIPVLISAVPWGHHKYIMDKCQNDVNTIGLLVCKSKDNTLAQYALESSSQPIGISEYELQKLYPTKVEGTIPTIAEIEGVVNDTKIEEAKRE